MSNTSHKYRNKKMWTWGIILIIVLLVVSFIISKSDTTVDPESFASIEVYKDSAHEKGNVESDIRLIEYSDFQCPACKAAEPAIAQLLDAYGDQFVLEYRNFPLRQIHPNAQVGAQAAEAAAMQGKFWEMHDLLFENQDEWSQSFNPERYFRQYAKEIGLNVDRFRYDFDSDEVKDRVNADYDEAIALAIPGTPGFVSEGSIVDVNDFIREHFQPVVPTS
ncbi:thioredoxin domain-containing protein [Patescibacteria group bacterium]|nr:thioredoxin domain-containing protein [Patescibacteria group bacterium]